MAMTTISGEVVGDGPVATVYSGHYKGMLVALKVFPGAFDKRTMAAFERERAALRQVSSILPVDGVDTLADGRQALRTALCPWSLASLVDRNGPLTSEDVVMLGRAVAQALAAAHGAGITHGGVTPSNVLFGASGEPLLADVGLTLRHAYPRDPLHAIEFRSPEATRTGTLDELNDLYGLGAVLHFSLTGRSPHPGRLGERPGERVLRVLGEPVPAINRPDVPVALSTVVARLLAVDPGNRPMDAATVAIKLAEIAAQLPTAPSVDVDDFSDNAARRVPVASFDYRRDAARPARSRRRVRQYLIGLAVLLGVVATILALILGSRPAEMTAVPEVPPPSSTVPASPSPPIRVDLADPVVEGETVTLTWQSTTPLDFLVVVTAEGEQAKYVQAGRELRKTVTIDPIRKYCFRITAARADRLVHSPSKGIRGATCEK